MRDKMDIPAGAPLWRCAGAPSKGRPCLDETWTSPNEGAKHVRRIDGKQIGCGRATIRVVAHLATEALEAAEATGAEP